MPIARDESLAPPLWPNGHRNKSGYAPPELLFDDNFDKGFGNWRNHQGGKTVNPPISRTALRAFDGSSKSLMLGVGGRPQTATIKSANCSAYNNMSRWVDNGLVKGEWWYTLGGADLDTNPGNILFGIDTQAWDDQSRGFYRMMCRRFTGPAESVVRANEWALVNDEATHVAIPAQGQNPVPPYPGDNENKMNWNYVSLTVDMDYMNPDGGRGRYHEAQIGPYIYDLRNLGAGRGKQRPQTASAVGAGSFAGGLNFGCSIQNRTVFTPAGPSWLLIGRARGTWYPKAGN